jgi:putative salt-induced outer membrane protein
MFRTARLAPVLALGLLLPLPGHAADESAESGGEPAWTGSVGLGLFNASGNTESTSTNFDLAAELTCNRWRHEFAANAFFASEDDEDTAERYSTRLQSNYSITERSYVFLSGRYEVDRFGAFDRRAALVAGLGRRFLDTDALRLDLEAGAGRRVSEPDGTNERNGETVGSLRGDFAWQFSDTSSLTQELEVVAGSDTTATRSVSGVKSNLTGDLALKVTYTVEHNSDVPPGTEKTDTFTAVTLEYGF